MADITLTASPVLSASVDIGANQITERTDLALVSVATPLGGQDTLATKIKEAWGLALPSPTVTSVSGEVRAMQTAAEQMFLVFPHATPDANAAVQAKLDGAAYTTDQTDVWVTLDVSGPETLRALERICPIDLSEDAFPIDASARTVMEHMGALLVRLETHRFLLLSARSSAASFLHAIEQSFRNVCD